MTKILEIVLRRFGFQPMMEVIIWAEAHKAGKEGIHFKELCRAVKPPCMGEFLDSIASLKRQGMIDTVGEDLRIVAIEKEG